MLKLDSVDSINKTRLILEKGGKLHPPSGIDIHVSLSKLKPSLKRSITQILQRNKSKIKFITKRSY